MLNQFSRTELIFGKDAMEKLFNSRIAVFGIGGVGSYTAEALVRSGVDAIDTVTAKLALVEKANENNIPIISAMGLEIK